MLEREARGYASQLRDTRDFEVQLCHVEPAPPGMTLPNARGGVSPFRGEILVEVDIDEPAQKSPRESSRRTTRKGGRS